jgi:hypothetical protein
MNSSAFNVSVDKYTIICKQKQTNKKVMQNTLSKLFDCISTTLP